MASVGTIRLRNLTERDLPVFFEQQLDPAFNWMAAFTEKDPSDRKEFDAHWERIRNDKTTIFRTVLLEDHVAGYVGSWADSGGRSVAYAVARKHWGKGVATAALSAFISEVKERPLFARAAKDNLASLSVLQKCGFTTIGFDTGFANARGKEIEWAILKLT